MRVALETYQSEGRHLAEPQQLLKNEGFYRKHTVQRVCVCVCVCVCERDWCLVWGATVG